MKNFDEFLNEGSKEMNAAAEKFATEVLAKMKILKKIVEDFFDVNMPNDSIKITCEDDDTERYNAKWWFINFMNHENESNPSKRLTVVGDDRGFMHRNLFIPGQGFYNMKIKGASKFADNLNVGCDGKSKLIIHVHVDANRKLSHEMNKYISKKFDPNVDLSYFKGAIKLNKYDL